MTSLSPLDGVNVLAKVAPGLKAVSASVVQLADGQVLAMYFEREPGPAQFDAAGPLLMDSSWSVSHHVVALRGREFIVAYLAPPPRTEESPADSPHQSFHPLSASAAVQTPGTDEPPLSEAPK